VTATGTRYDSPIATDRNAINAGLATVVPRADFDRFQAIAKARGITKGALLREVVHAFVEWQMLLVKLSNNPKTDLNKELGEFGALGRRKREPP
jgi:hypothetical protein